MITSEAHLYIPNEFYSSFPTLLLRTESSGMATRAHSDTPSYTSSLEPSYSKSLEESASIVPSEMHTRYHSNTPTDAPILESSSSPSLEKPVTPSIVISHKSSVA